MKKLFIITVCLGTLFLVGCQKTEPLPINTQISTGVEITGAAQSTGILVESFEDCLNAGFPIMESYPRQCNDGTTTYTEDISDILSGQQSSGENPTEQTNETTGTNTSLNEANTIDNTKVSTESTGTNITLLQAKLRAMMERRAQQTQTTANQTQTTTNSTASNTPTTVSGNNNVTEDDIENLEKIINEIIKK